MVVVVYSIKFFIHFVANKTFNNELLFKNDGHIRACRVVRIRVSISRWFMVNITGVDATTSGGKIGGDFGVVKEWEVFSIEYKIRGLDMVN